MKFLLIVKGTILDVDNEKGTVFIIRPTIRIKYYGMDPLN